LILAFAIAAIASALIVEGVRRWTMRRQILDVPNQRSSHSTPTPPGGGIAIVVVTTIGVIAGHAAPWRDLAALLVPAAIIAVVSWIDDMHHTSPLLRITVHLGTAIAAVIFFGGWSNLWLPLIGTVHLGWFGLALTVVWIVGLTNAYNFMDGIDGIAGLQAVIAGGAWALLALRDSMPLVAWSGLLLAASSLGFLVLNWSPAKIFMGDVGSAFLGYLFAVLTVIASRHDPRLALCGVLFVWPFVFDTVFTVIRRALRGERLHEAHRSHLYQRLNQTGISHARVAMLYGVLALIGAASLIAIVPALIAASIAAIALVGWVLLRERHVGSPA
jgi:UDP-N-acetylmuramyl pentapeptide phosphotransferase/UDP-N-acetylglucosamine-1-phosphate transferase